MKKQKEIRRFLINLLHSFATSKIGKQITRIKLINIIPVNNSTNATDSQILKQATLVLSENNVTYLIKIRESVALICYNFIFH